MPRHHQDELHPGAILREEYLRPLALSQAALAHHLRVSRTTVSQLIRGACGVSFEMAHRLGQAFGTGAEYWLVLQVRYDLAISPPEERVPLIDRHGMATRIAATPSPNGTRRPRRGGRLSR